MTITSLRFTRSETRDLSDRDRLDTGGSRMSEPVEWRMRDGTFYVALVTIAAGLALLALLLTVR